MGIEITNKIKYLGFTFSRTKKQIYADTRSHIMKHINYVIGKFGSVKNQYVK